MTSGPAPGPSAAAPSPDDLEPIHRRITWLVGGRLVVATILLGSTVLLPSGLGLGTSALAWLALSVYGASLGTLVWMKRRVATRALVATQIVFDLAFTTALVWLTGGAVSSFSFLFGVVVLLSAILAGPRTVATTAGLAGVLYLATAISIASAWVPDPSGLMLQLEPGELGGALLRNAVGLFLVGLLGSVLSDRLRRADGELRRVAESAAGYARLTEDIVRSLDSGLITTDLDGRIRSVNGAGARILGAHPEALVGTAMADLLPQIPLTPERERGEAVAKRLDGTTLPVGFTRTPLVGADGRAHGSLVLFQDLTEISELRAKAEKAERLAVLGRLAAGLAHEIRNPLGSISGSVQLVRDAEVLSEEDRRLLGMVLGEVERLNELVTTMLDVGRPVTPDRALLDLRPLAAEVVEVARRGATARSSGVTVRLEQDEAPVRAHADPAQLRQLLWNLVKNAIQFSPREGEVRVAVRTAPTGEAVLEVQDRGPGVEAPDRERLFDMFFTKREHGVGLGLALVKQIVDAHGGTIEVESRLGEGALFRVTLPAAPAPADLEAQ